MVAHLPSERISIDDDDGNGDDTQANSYVHYSSQLVRVRPTSDILDVSDAIALAHDYFASSAIFIVR